MRGRKVARGDYFSIRATIYSKIVALLATIFYWVNRHYVFTRFVKLRTLKLLRYILKFLQGARDNTATSIGLISYC